MLVYLHQHLLSLLQVLPGVRTKHLFKSQYFHGPQYNRWYSVVVSISGCDPLDPGSNPGTAMFLEPINKQRYIMTSTAAKHVNKPFV